MFQIEAHANLHQGCWETEAAHIYSRVGRWHDAVLANQKAIAADTAYLEMCRGNVQGNYPLGYVPHNPRFLWFAASMEGASEVAREAAVQTAARVDNPELMRQPGYAAQQHYWMTPWFDGMRFGRWDEIVKLPNPAPDLPYVTAIWHYAHGMAAVRQGRHDDAQAHLEALGKAAADPVMDTLTVWDRATGDNLVWNLELMRVALSARSGPDGEKRRNTGS